MFHQRPIPIFNYVHRHHCRLHKQPLNTLSVLYIPRTNLFNTQFLSCSGAELIPGWKDFFLDLCWSVADGSLHGSLLSPALLLIWSGRSSILNLSTPSVLLCYFESKLKVLLRVLVYFYLLFLMKFVGQRFFEQITIISLFWTILCGSYHSTGLQIPHMCI